MDLGQVFTDNAVADFMASLLSVRPSARILDPCFGKGVFIDACLRRGYKNITGCEIDPALYSYVEKKYPGIDLICGDFLKADPALRYDAVIMNPPYIRQEKIDDLKPLGITKSSVRKDPVFGGLPGAANMYMYFIVKALSLLEQGGEMVAIFPVSWQNAKSGREFEKLMRFLGDVERHIRISGKIFETAEMVEVVILKMRRSDSPGGLRESIEYARLADGRVTVSHSAPDEGGLDMPVEFSAYADIRRGLTTGCNGIFINPPVPESDTVPIISGPKCVTGYSTENAAKDRLLKITGSASEETAAYLTSCAESIKDQKRPRTLYDKIAAGKKWYELQPPDGAGIIFSYFVRSGMKFIMNASGDAVRDNFYIIYPKIDRLLMFALLNNYYTYYQLERCGKRHGAGLLKLQRYDLEQLCFPDVSGFKEDDKKTLIKLSKKMISTGKNMSEEITGAISGYAPWSFERISGAYKNLRKSRLEEGGYGAESR